MSFTRKIDTAVVLAPHPDDGEFGCGATLNKLISQGTEVHYVAFSPCTISVPDGFDKDVLFKELNSATEKLGINKKNVTTFTFPVRELSSHRQEILEELIKLRNSIQPDLVLLPASTDIHQDHQTIYNEGVRAFKYTSILGYEMPWNNLTITTNFHVNIDEDNLQAKWDAINSYESQSGRNYKDFEFIKGLARLRGTQINTKYAEAFELIRWII
ncbi:MAG: PIG-L family deacetylase [Flavobacteriales bacterium]|nr:PIG-L family deacetylase [Flavobacteriales bacterium]